MWDDSYFENLLVEVDSANNVSAVIIKYILNSSTTDNTEHDSFYLDAEMEVTNIDYNDVQAKLSAYCVGILMCPEGGSDHVAGAE
jgi:hypothetical protein